MVDSKYLASSNQSHVWRQGVCKWGDVHPLHIRKHVLRICAISKTNTLAWPPKTCHTLPHPRVDSVWKTFDENNTVFQKCVYMQDVYFAVFYRAHCVRKVLRFAVLTKESFTLMHTSYTYPQYMWSAALYMYINVCTYKQTHWKSLNPPCSWVWLRAWETERTVAKEKQNALLQKRNRTHCCKRETERTVAEEKQNVLLQKRNRTYCCRKLCQYDLRSIFKKKKQNVQVATTCFSCSPPDLNLVVTNFMFCLHVK